MLVKRDIIAKHRAGFSNPCKLCYPAMLVADGKRTFHEHPAGEDLSATSRRVAWLDGPWL